MAHIKTAWNLSIYHIWREQNYRLKRGQFRSAASLISQIYEELSLILGQSGHKLGYAGSSQSIQRLLLGAALTLLGSS